MSIGDFALEVDGATAACLTCGLPYYTDSGHLCPGPPLPHYLAGVRHVSCPLCWARPGEACQRYYPPADHLARWLDAFDAGYVAEAHLKSVVGRLTVLTRRVLVREDVAA